MIAQEWITGLHVGGAVGILPLHVPPTIGGNIRRLREAAGFQTQGAFAKALDVPQPRLSDWENDRYGIPEVANLIKIAKILKVSLDQLIAGVDGDYDNIVARRSDLIRQPGMNDGASENHSPGGVSDVPATARVLAEVGQRYDAFVREVSDVASQFEAAAHRLAALTAEQPALIKDGPARKTPARKRRHRSAAR